MLGHEDQFDISILSVAVAAIIQNEPQKLRNLIESQTEITMELALAIGTHAWRADIRSKQVGASKGFMWAFIGGLLNSPINFGVMKERRDGIVIFMGALAAKHDEPLILEMFYRWEPLVLFPNDFFVREPAHRCLKHTLKRAADKLERVEANQKLVENLRHPETTATAPPVTPTQPPTSKRLSPPRPGGGESEHMRAYRAREVAESAARAEAERDARAKIEADRKERRVTASKPTRLNNGVNPPQKTKNLVDGPLDAHARAKQVTKKAAAVESTFVHASKLKLAEEARVAAAEAKLSLIRIGREIGGA